MKGGAMRILYSLTTGTADPTKASLPLHLAVNGSLAIGDEVAIFLAGDGTEYLAEGAIDSARGIGVPPLAELFAKIREFQIPVHV
jgi:predicted peroxiredoxin